MNIKEDSYEPGKKNKKVNWKKAPLYLIPGYPVYSLIREFSKPKNERKKGQIYIDVLGTLFFLSTKVLPATGIISLAVLDPFGFYSDNSKTEQKIEVKNNKIDSSKLEKTISLDYLEKNNLKN